MLGLNNSKQGIKDLPWVIIAGIVTIEYNNVAYN